MCSHIGIPDIQLLVSSTSICSSICEKRSVIYTAVLSNWTVQMKTRDHKAVHPISTRMSMWVLSVYSLHTDLFKKKNQLAYFKCSILFKVLIKQITFSQLRSILQSWLSCLLLCAFKVIRRADPDASPGQSRDRPQKMLTALPPIPNFLLILFSIYKLFKQLFPQITMKREENSNQEIILIFYCRELTLSQKAVTDAVNFRTIHFTRKSA